MWLITSNISFTSLTLKALCRTQTSAMALTRKVHLYYRDFVYENSMWPNMMYVDMPDVFTLLNGPGELPCEVRKTSNDGNVMELPYIAFAMISVCSRDGSKCTRTQMYSYSWVLLEYSTRTRVLSSNCHKYSYKYSSTLKVLIKSEYIYEYFWVLQKFYVKTLHWSKTNTLLAKCNKYRLPFSTQPNSYR